MEYRDEGIDAVLERIANRLREAGAEDPVALAEEVFLMSIRWAEPWLGADGIHDLATETVA